jgi:DNA-binding transcriptional LysR family regulator
MDVQDLRIFARVARVQNLSSVGAEFNLSAGTISKRLQSLEAELSVRLFDRTTRSISITEEGEKLLADIEPILERIDRAIETLEANVQHPRGRLRVSAPTTLGRCIIAPAICAFLKRYPEIEVHIDLTDRIESILESGYDVAIRTGQLADSSLIAKRLALDPLVVVACPEYLEAHGSPKVPDDLAAHSCLMLGDEQQWTFKKEGKTLDVRVGGRLRSDDGELLRHAALEGIGLLRIARSRVADELRAGALLPILVDYDSGNDAAIWAVYPSNRYLLPKLRVFLEFLSEWFRECRRPVSRGGGFAALPSAATPTGTS